MALPRMDSRSANLYCRTVHVCNELCRSVSSVVLACMPSKHTGLPAFQAATHLQPDADTGFQTSAQQTRYIDPMLG